MKRRQRLLMSNNSGGFQIPRAGLAAAFDANIGITSAGGFASAWADQSGNGRNLLQATGANQPAYDTTGGIPSLIFNGTSHFMKTAPFTLNQPETVYLVVKQVSWTATDFFFDGDSADSMLVYQNLTTPKIRAYAGTLSDENSDLAIGAKGVIATVFNGASSVLQVNAGTAVTGNFGSANAGGFILGARAVSFSGNSNIQVYEVRIYTVAHDAATRANIIRALMSKHGVA